METNCILSVDLLETILSRLTVRQLVQLRCTCKSWCSLIDSISFIQLHYRHQYSVCKDEPPLFCLDAGIPLSTIIHENYYLLCDYQWEHEHVTDLTNGLLGKTPIDAEAPYAYNVELIGVLNGIVCLQWGGKEIGFWNPATRDFKLIEYYRLNLPRRKISATLQLIGFGFDIVSNDFKVVGVNLWGNTETITDKHCKVYSLNADTWKNINVPETVFNASTSVRKAFLNGVCYWPTNVVNPNCGFDRGVDMIMSFNFANEVFEISDLPKDARLCFNNVWEYTSTLQLYLESIALMITNVNSEAGESMVDIWIAAEFDYDSRVPLSWDHFFNIPLTPTFSTFSTLWVYGSRNRVNLILQIDDENFEASYYCSRYNPSPGMFKKLGITIDTCFNFVESLFPLSNKPFKDGVLV